MSLASLAMAGGMVAENSSVWRSLAAGGDDLPHVADEAHVEHAVGLVEHEDRHLVELDMALVQRSSRRPGVAMRISTPAFSAFTWWCWLTPPKMTVERKASLRP